MVVTHSLEEIGDKLLKLIRIHCANIRLRPPAKPALPPAHRSAASKPNASLGKARLRIAAPQERQTSKKSPSSPESARPAAGEDRRAEGWRQSLPASEHGGGAEFASFVKLPVERLHPRLISMIPTSVLLVKHAKLCAVRAPERRPNSHSLLHRGDDARPR